MSVASEITRLQNAKASLKSSINAKTDSSHKITNETIDNYANFVDSISTGGSSEVQEKDVNFYDYDGTRLYSYTKNEFLNLSAMPTNPIHEGLTAQGWNWNLVDAQTFISSNDKLNIGQMYNTDDNSTRIYITLLDKRTSPYLSFAVNGTAIINWGDNTTTSVSGSDTTTLIRTQHNYTNAGDYIIKIASQSKLYFKGTSTRTYLLSKGTTQNNEDIIYASSIKKIELGNVDLGDYALAKLYLIEKILISINTTISGIGTLLQNYVMKNIVIPNTITNLPNQTFSNVRITKYMLPNTITSLGDNCFLSNQSITEYILPNSITAIGSGCFQNNYSLEKINIPNNIIDLNSNVYTGIYCINKYIIPSSVANIMSATFSNNNGVAYYDFSMHTSIPTMNTSGTLAFVGIPNDCKIIVPNNLYSSWRSASGWSTYQSNIIKKSDWDAM